MGRLVFVAICALLAGCAPAPSDGPEVAAMSADALELINAEASLLAAATDGINLMTAEHAASNAALNASATFTPEGCVTATTELSAVSYTVNDCTGTFGVQHVTGSYVVGFATDATGAFSFHATTPSLAVFGAVMMPMDVVGTYAAVGGAQTITASTTVNGTGSRGTPLTVTATFTYAREGATDCAQLDATWTATSAAQVTQGTLTGFRRCGIACPAPGGALDVTGAVAGPIHVPFNGNDTVTWTAPHATGTLTLLCTGHTGVLTHP